MSQQANKKAQAGEVGSTKKGEEKFWGAKNRRDPKGYLAH